MNGKSKLTRKTKNPNTANLQSGTVKKELVERSIYELRRTRNWWWTRANSDQQGQQVGIQAEHEMEESEDKLGPIGHVYVFSSVYLTIMI